MKGITADALYQCLLEDLSPHLVHENAPEESPKSVACRALRDNLFKKLISAIKPDAEAKALEKFLAINERCKNWKLEIETLEDEFLIGHLRQVIYEFLYPRSEPLISCFEDLFDHGKLGPGVSLGSDSNDFFTKLFSSRLTTTSLGLSRAYANYIGRFPLWAQAEENRLGLYGAPEVVEGNRLTFVPKTDEISRTICVEPVLNMFCQQGMKYLLEGRLKSYFGIDLSQQQMKNRELARIGSANDCAMENASSFAAYVTIDLSSASDSLSCSMIDYFFPRDFVAWLNLLRCSKSKLPSGEWLELGMISTMGNAFTFPLQTILFSSVVVAAARTAGVDENLRRPYGTALGDFGVNGDDIICPRLLARKVLRLLTLLGFQVNATKSFGSRELTEGPFRESCGADFYKGVDVRPVFCKKLDSPQDLFSLINRLNVWSFVQGVPLYRTLRYLLRRVPRYEVPAWENVDCGIWIPCSFMLSTTPKRRQGSYLYKRWVPVASGLRVDSENEVIHVPRGRKPIRYNREGMYLAFLRGNVTSGRILLRPEKVRYVTKVACAPNWEYSPTIRNPFIGSGGGPDLERLACCTF